MVLQGVTGRRSASWILVALAALVLVAAACTCSDISSLVPPSATGGGSGPDGGDGYTTTGGGTITVGGSGSGSIGSLFEAHNWSFQGTAGQSVTINVVGQGDCDPRIRLLDASGNVIGEDDDSGGGYNALLTETLPADGTYYIRIDVFTAGSYTVTLQ